MSGSLGQSIRKSDLPSEVPKRGRSKRKRAQTQACKRAQTQWWATTRVLYSTPLDMSLLFARSSSYVMLWVLCTLDTPAASIAWASRLSHASGEADRPRPSVWLQCSLVGWTTKFKNSQYRFLIFRIKLPKSYRYRSVTALNNLLTVTCTCPLSPPLIEGSGSRKLPMHHLSESISGKLPVPLPIWNDSQLIRQPFRALGTIRWIELLWLDLPIIIFWGEFSCVVSTLPISRNNFCQFNQRNSQDRLYLVVLSLLGPRKEYIIYYTKTFSGN